MIRNLLVRFWNDESGAVIAAEYLLLGTVVAVGSVTGLTAVRDSVNDEYKEFGNSVREVRQSYAKPAMRGAAGSAGGTTVTDAAPAPSDLPTVPVVPNRQAAQVTFSSP